MKLPFLVFLTYPATRLLIVTIIFCASGVALTEHLSAEFIASLLAVAFFILIATNAKVVRLNVSVRGALSYSAFALLVLLLVRLEDPRSRSSYCGFHAGEAKHRFTGRVSEEPVDFPTYLQFKAEIDAVESTKTTGTLLVYVSKPCPVIRFDDRLLFEGLIKEIDEPPSPNAFNRKQFLEFHHIYHSLSLKGAGIVSVTGPSDHTLQYWAKYCQNKCAVLLRQSGKTKASDFLSTLLLGSRSSIDPDLYQAFSKTGTVHIISVSGLHVQLIYAVFAFLIPAYKGGRAGNWYACARTIFLIATVWGYVLISGWSAAAVRSALMISFFIGSSHLPYRLPSAIVLCSSAIFMLLCDPWSVADIGFQLSYLAVASLIAFQRKISGLFKFSHALLRVIWQLCSTSIAAQVLTLPVCFYYFHGYPLYFIFANLFVIPLTTVLLFSGIAQLVLAALIHSGRLSETISFVITKSFGWMEMILKFISGVPHSSLVGYYPDFADLLILFVLIISLLEIKKDKRLISSLSFKFTTIALGVGLAKNAIFQFNCLTKDARILIKTRTTSNTIVCCKGNGYISGSNFDQSFYNRYLLPELLAHRVKRVYDTDRN